MNNEYFRVVSSFRHSGRHGIVHEHGNVEIAALKRLRDVFASAFGCCSYRKRLRHHWLPLGLHRRSSSGRSGAWWKSEKTHTLFPALVHLRMGVMHRTRNVRVLRLRFLLVGRCWPAT